VAQVTGQDAPDIMTEDSSTEFEAFDDGYNPSDPADRAVMATRKAVFPLHGLMP
jgi:acetoin utilization protein AcuC